MNALRAAGLTAVKAFPAGAMPELMAAVTAVGLKRARGSHRAVYEYLGIQEEPNGTLTPLYGRPLEAELLLTVLAPRRLGGQGAMAEAERVTALIAGPVPGVHLEAFTVEGPELDGKSDCYRCTVTVTARGYLYALANSDETEFTDFILKGEVK